MKDALDQSIAYANGGIDRLRAGRRGAAAVDAWLEAPRAPSLKRAFRSSARA